MPNRLWSSSSTPNQRLTAVSGYLWKMKRERRVLVPQWNRRFFTIEGTSINWYSDEYSTTPRHKLPLVSITSISPFETSGGVYSFIVSSKSRNLFLRAESLHLMEMWVRAIQMHADLARGGDGTHLICASSPNIAMKAKNKKNRSLEEALEKSIRDLEALERQTISDESNPPTQVKTPAAVSSHQSAATTRTGESVESYGDLHVYTFDGRRSCSNDMSSPARSPAEHVYSPPPLHDREAITEYFDSDLPSPPLKSMSERFSRNSHRGSNALGAKCKSEAWA